jgi:hypothetical protein
MSMLKNLEPYQILIPFFTLYVDFQLIKIHEIWYRDEYNSYIICNILTSFQRRSYPLHSLDIPDIL